MRPTPASRRPAMILGPLVLAGALVVGAPSAASAAPCANAGRTVAAQGTAKARTAVRCLVNQHRAAAGLRPLAADARATRAAQRHTDDMVRRRYFDHVSPDGSSVADRVSATGLRWRSVGENIAVGQRTPAAVVRGWMRSPGHRANILSDRFTVLGVGVDRRGTRGYPGATWTQVFVRPR